MADEFLVCRTPSCRHAVPLSVLCQAEGYDPDKMNLCPKCANELRLVRRCCKDCALATPADAVNNGLVCHADSAGRVVSPSYWCRNWTPWLTDKWRNARA